MDHYQTLGVERSATDADIRAAYKRLAMKWHPDRHAGEADKSLAEENFKSIHEAYRTLSDQRSRQMYDHSLDEQLRPAGFAAGMNDYFEEMMRQYARQSRPYDDYGLPPGADVKWKAIIPLKTALEGGEVIYTRKVQVQCDGCRGNGYFYMECSACEGVGHLGRPGARARFCGECQGVGNIPVNCSDCGGKGKISQSVSSRIRIPAGVVNGSEIVAQKLGKPSRYQRGAPGDLQIVISIKPEGGFKFSGLDITGTLKIPFSVALLGGTVELGLPTGRRLQVDIPARSNSGKRIRLAECGMRDRDGRVGDALMVVSIVLPKSRRQLAAAEEAVIRSLDQ